MKNISNLNNIKRIDIQDILPQKPPFLFIDKIKRINITKGIIVCEKTFKNDEYFFKGHFPGNPLVPGVILVEAMAQASILLYAFLKPKIAQQHPKYLLGRIEANFKKPVYPDQTILIEIKKEKIIDTAGIVKGSIKIQNNLIAEALLSFGLKLQ